MKNDSIVDRINVAGDSLTESEKCLAQVTLENISSLATYSATELAELAGVSKATTVRFFKRLGYKSFSEVRLQVRTYIDEGSPLYGLAKKENKNQVSDYFESYVESEVKNLKQTYAHLDAKNIKKAIELIKNSQNVYVVGFRNGKNLAQYTWGMLTQLRENIQLLPSASSMNITEEIIDMKVDDCLIVMDYRRRVSLLGPIVEHAKKQNIKVIMFTDLNLTDLATHADVVFRTATHSIGMFDSYIAAFSLINGLCTQFAFEQGEQAKLRLEKVEKLHDQLNYLNIEGR
ncbi:MurR/RpiR family transcriptional regulator [Acinetobacter sp. V102_4]|uniref:MurR/RpiR family transcriptional regulator n=1 Tax=Acinetobacter sp. V102_4 TaxID=3072984 RepID=UPI00287EBBFA|nr:MurR/RpiR family transcriptional regulator [Acinetobacter sp. V102_4]MDS7928281.1 MurR/RpiR family transcriptional regulator [Acinetobacter sp. V102_4]